MKPIFFTVLFIITSSFCIAQEIDQKYFQGFQNEVSGKRFGYHSPFPDVKNSLLLRGQEDYLPIVWNTEIVPENYPNDYVIFVWVFGMDVSSDQVGFDLFVNETKMVSFFSSKTSELGLSTIKGNHGSTLTFNVTLLDKYEDQMGFAILKLPVSAIKSKFS